MKTPEPTSLADSRTFTPLVSRYGMRFDGLAERWANLEREHDAIHPDRNDCGGVGGCSMMLAAYEIRSEMIEALKVWRRNR